MKDQRKVAAAALWLAAALITGCAEMPQTGKEPRNTAPVAGGLAAAETDDGTQALLDDSSEASSAVSSRGEGAPRLAPGAAPRSRGAVTRWASGRKGGDGEGAGPRFATQSTREKPRPEPPAIDPPAINIEKLRGTETPPAVEPDAEPTEAVPPADEGAPADADAADADAASPDSSPEAIPEDTEPADVEVQESDAPKEADEATDPVPEIEQPDSDPVPEIENPDPVQETEKKAGEDLDSLLKDLDES